MGTYTWRKIAQSNTKTELNASYKFELYQWLLSDPDSVETIILKSDFRLRRGKPSPKSKFNYITHTAVYFSIIDESFWLIDKLRSDEETNFKGVILKNASTFYAGYVTLKLKDLLYKKTNEVVPITLYDGMKRLQGFDDLTVLGTGLTQMKEVLRTLFNKLNLELNINAYQNIYHGYDDTVSNAKQLYLIYIKIEDYINALGNRINLYDFLIVLCKQFDWNVFQENGVWVIRQNVSMIKTINYPIDGIWKEVVNYSTGVYSASKVDMDRAIANSDLRADPKTFENSKIDKVETTINTYKAYEPPRINELTEELEWINPFFTEKDNGWTTASGTPDYKSNSVYMNNGDEIKQTLTGLNANDTIIVKLSASCIRVILDVTEDFAAEWDNPLFRITYEGTSKPYYLNAGTLLWDTVSTNNQIFGGVMYGRFPQGSYLEVYDMITRIVDIEKQLPAEDGELVIRCFGGGPASGNGYTFEQGAILNYAVAAAKTYEQDEGDVPNNFILNSYISNAKDIFKIDIPFADYLPFNGATIWAIEKDAIPPATNYVRTDNWTPDGGLLIQNIAERIIKQNRNKKGYDIKLVPGTSLNFIDLVKMDLESEGSDSYYLPVFEDAYLIKDHRRFILLKHNYDSPTITTETEFIFPNS